MKRIVEPVCWPWLVFAGALTLGACAQDGGAGGQPGAGIVPTPIGDGDDSLTAAPPATAVMVPPVGTGDMPPATNDGTAGAVDDGMAASDMAASDAGAADDSGVGVGVTDAGDGVPEVDAGDGADADDMGGEAGGPPAKFCGNITTGGMVRSDFIDYWNQITPENEGKWGSVEGTRDVMRWGGLDAAYDYAREHGIPFKQHTFVWGSQQPGWIASLPQAQQREEVEEWIRLYCERYPDTAMIDVVNEPPPHTTPSYAAALGGAGASGYDWIVQSFQWARQYCPGAILILNDYNTIEYGNDNSHFIDIVERVVTAGAPVDAIGAQAHDAHKIPTGTVEMYIDRLAATGLPVYISEYDINLSSDSQQRDVMAAQFEMFWHHEAVAGVTLWGYIEGRTWLANTGLMTSGGQQRPAMVWLMDYLQTP